jgi:hypothetical protein
MRGRRFLVVALGVLCVVVALPGVGASRNTATSACGREEFVGGLEAVFGRFKTQAAAQSFRARVAAAGFQNLNIIPGCNEYRVVLRGIDSFDIGVELQDEARRFHYPVTLECIAAKDDVGELEVVFGHRRTRFDAQVLVNRAAALGFLGLQLENDPCGGFEVMIKGFTGRGQAEDFVDEAKRAGFNVAIESS